MSNRQHRQKAVNPPVLCNQKDLQWRPGIGKPCVDGAWLRENPQPGAPELIVHYRAGHVFALAAFTYIGPGKLGNRKATDQ
jgi:hypothetical protein